MNQNQTDDPKKPEPSTRPSRRELRASLLLPVVITMAIWIVGLLVFAVVPGQFDTVVSLTIGLSLLVFLIFWTRRVQPGLRLQAVLLALPALAGITAGIISGRSSYALVGAGITFLLLFLQRLWSTPVSYRAAYRRFHAGDTEQALELINKSIAARPDFQESYQLRALIHLAHMDFTAAEQDARKAIELKPKAHSAAGTLGQVYLAQERFDEAKDAYRQALSQAPENALYHYYLGFSRYQLDEYRQAADALATATQGTLPIVEYDLLAHYYLGRSLEALAETEQAQQVYQEMRNFKEGLPALKEELQEQPDYAHLYLIRADLDDLERRIASQLGA